MNISVAGKLVFCLLASLGCLVSGDPAVLAPLALAASVYALCQIGLARLWRCYLIIVAVGCAAWLSTSILFALWPSLAGEAVDFAAATPALRLLIVANAILVMAAGINLKELFGAVAKAPLPYVLKLPLLLMIRFAPSVSHECRLLREAVGIRFGGRGILAWLARPGELWRAAFVPGVIRTLRLADDLAIAAELKGVGPASFSSAGGKLFRANDYLLFLGWICLLAVVLAVNPKS